MAEPTQYSFSLRELTIALIKEQGLHEGLWMASFEFTFGAGLLGAPPEEVKPSAFVQINRVQLIRQNGPVPQGAPLVVDAAQVNPELSPEQPAQSPRGKRSGASDPIRPKRKIDV